jgi:epoxyqueuosine reductase
LLRNAAIVLGNQRAAGAIGPLEKGLNDEEPVVRGACAWALGQIGTESAHTCLRRRAGVEGDAEVCNEIKAALDVALT